MVPSWRTLERIVLVGLFSTLGLSTGVASLSLESHEAITGHTGFVAVVGPGPQPDLADRTPVDYGLASSREVWLWGAYTREKALPPERQQMAFAWREDAPDPRHDPSLVPTGEYARVRDAGGTAWIVHEFRYAGFAAFDTDAYQRAGPADLYAYGVRVGNVHHGDPDATGTPDGRYNHVLTYRLDRLFPELDGAAVPEALQVVRGLGAPTTPEALGTDLAAVLPGAAETAGAQGPNGDGGQPSGPAHRYAVSIGVGPTPALVDIDAAA